MCYRKVGGHLSGLVLVQTASYYQGTLRHYQHAWIPVHSESEMSLLLAMCTSEASFAPCSVSYCGHYALHLSLPLRSLADLAHL